MKISISYPPLESNRGTPLLSQNRQFQWFHKATFIYPMVPAYAATLLKQNGYDVFWDDGIAEKLSYQMWSERLKKENPQLIAMETKTPVVKKHWEIISDIKTNLPDSIVVLMGDHITALPEESLENSNADYCLSSGDYDFSLLSLCNFLSKGDPLCGGWYFKDQNGNIKNTGQQNLSANDLNLLPHIDRQLTKWQLYAYENGNFKYTPGTYTMAGRDCWWGKCTFCSWTTLFPAGKFRTIKPARLLDDIEKNLIPLGIKEIFDDTGCFPAGQWLIKFCEGFIERSLYKKISFSCNMRFGVLKQKHYDLMAKANFRLVLFGIESANQETIDKIDKKINIQNIPSELQLKNIANKTYKGCISPHVTTMIGYPWENYADAKATIDFTKALFNKGLIDTLQATIVIPYPGTPLFKEAKEKGWLATEDWNDFDMRQLVFKGKITTKEAMELTQGIYKSFIVPGFIIRKLLSIRSLNDLKYLIVSGVRVISHLLDFKK
ncbi:MAG: B12-binding domain-containing radical SAM protein [Candidatus Magnetoovum sp. WYHC-5]|nr:B12-binding domain-containing radical SAM protein [Candidatus Magnetoovum sp. WYHC-5]